MRARNTKDDSLKRSDKLLLVVIALSTILILAGLFLYPYLRGPPPSKAAIVDQLSSSRLTNSSRYENETFITLTRNLLTQRFSEIDYYSDNATIDNYRRLSSSGYKLIIWRAHSALNNESMYIAICSSEEYYGQDYDRRLTLCNITGDPRLYLAITSDFVRDSMYGRFEDTVVVFMSCNGLKQDYNKTAQAFSEKGVKAFVSWDGWIGSADNDHAMALLLSYLISENNTISEAVGRIPVYDSPLYGPSRLRYYPAVAADRRIPDYRQGSTGLRAGLSAVPATRKNSRFREDLTARPVSACASKQSESAHSSTHPQTS